MHEHHYSVCVCVCVCVCACVCSNNPNSVPIILQNSEYSKDQIRCALFPSSLLISISSFISILVRIQKGTTGAPMFL